MLAYLDGEDIEGYARALKEKRVQAELAEYSQKTNDSRLLEKMMGRSEEKYAGLGDFVHGSIPASEELHDTGAQIDEVDRWRYGE